MSYESTQRRCVWCNDYALDDHLTCGRVQCSESDARATRDGRIEPCRCCGRAGRAATPGWCGAEECAQGMLDAGRYFGGRA